MSRSTVIAAYHHGGRGGECLAGHLENGLCPPLPLYLVACLTCTETSSSCPSLDRSERSVWDWSVQTTAACLPASDPGSLSKLQQAACRTCTYSPGRFNPAAACLQAESALRMLLGESPPAMGQQGPSTTPARSRLQVSRGACQRSRGALIPCSSLCAFSCACSGAEAAALPLASPPLQLWPHTHMQLSHTPSTRRGMHVEAHTMQSAGSAGAVQIDCRAAMLSRDACLDSACRMWCFLMQEPVQGSSKAKTSAGSPTPASCRTPTRRYSRSWDELTPVSQTLLSSPDRVPAHLPLAAVWVPSRVLDSGTLLGSSAQVCGRRVAYSALGVVGACRPHGFP